MARVTSHQSPVTPSDLWTIVPMKSMARGKLRLSSVLDPAARARLNRWLLERTLAAIGRRDGGLGHSIVVSPCDKVLALARAAGAVVLREAGGGGLNRAVSRAAALAARRGARRTLVIPCDLPGITAGALAVLLRAASGPGDMVIAPDRARTGTNALLVSVERPFEFRFGEGSFARHLLLAAERGWKATIVSRPALEFDLDTPEDLATWRSRTKRATRSALFR